MCKESCTIFPVHCDFLDLTELSIRCAGLENGINHDGLMHHAHSLLALELQLDQLLEEIRTLNDR